ncbi:hypothetical protein JW905_15565 [bacterium]|nr:hypothetical protein [candidate division CSSED10-310 bacterium]
MMYEGEDLRLIDGGLGNQRELPCHDDSPTWILDQAWDEVKQICRNALDAYMDYCREEGLPHSYLLGLDVLIMGEADPDDPRHVRDIRPTLVEGPCCNSYPACPNLDSYKLYRRLQAKGFNPDRVTYDVHPTKIREKIARALINMWSAHGHDQLPRVGIFTRPYPESEEEASHVAMLEGFKLAGLEAYRVTPDENPTVRDGRLWVHGKPLDVCYRRIERIHIPIFYGEQLGRRIIEDTPHTLFFNPLKIDDLRSKTIEERVFRRWEAKTGVRISRPRTLLGDEITPGNVTALADAGGYVMKRWNSTGGKGVFLHLNMARAKTIAEQLYVRYDGRHMLQMDAQALTRHLAEFADFHEDTAIQQLRLVDARVLGDRKRLVYDTRINALYDAEAKQWDFISGISRSVPCGDGIESGNSLLTNITAGAEISPLVMGTSNDPSVLSDVTFGPLLTALMNGAHDYRF